MRTHLIVVLAALGVGGCGSTRRALVDDAAGVTPGSPVTVAGVRVGDVDDVRVVGGHAELSLNIDEDDDVQLRQGACASAIPATDARPARVSLQLGAGSALDDDERIAECEPPALEPRPVTERLPHLLPPEPPDPPAGPRCPGLEARVLRTEAVGPISAMIPDGGHRVWLEFSNTTDVTMQVGSISDATFANPERRAITPARVPTEAEAWNVPFDVPAHGTSLRTVLFGGPDAPRLDELEARRSAPAADPTAWCTLRSARLRS